MSTIRVLSVVIVFLAGIAWKGYPIAALLNQRCRKSKKPCNLPVLNVHKNDWEAAKTSFIDDLAGLLLLGRRLHRTTGFQLWTTEGWLVILPEEYIDEIKSRHHSVLDGHEPLTNEFIRDYEWWPLFAGNRVTPATIQEHMVNQMANRLPDLMDEIEFGLDTVIPACNEWTPVPIFPIFLRITALTAGRMFVGLELGRDPEWLECGMNFTIDLAKGGWEMRRRSLYQKLWAHHTNSIPEIRKIHYWQDLARRRIVPIIKERQRKLEEDPKYIPPSDFITWNMEEGAKQSPPLSYEYQSRFQLELFLAAIHFNTMTITHILYDLLAHSEYIEPLRAEISELWNYDGSSAQNLTKSDLHKLPKLDSFLKESQRLSLPRLVAIDRVVQDPAGLTFNDGLHLPYKTYIAFNSYGMSLDPTIYDDPTTFDGMRYYDMRQANPEQMHRFAYAATDPRTSIAFGHGKYACTGRAWASGVMKLLVAYLLMRYDVQPTEETEERLPNTMRGPQVNVDMTGRIMLRRRSKGSR